MITARLATRRYVGALAAISVVCLAAPASAAPEVGVMVDAGLPDGAAASVTVRPLSFVRLHAGLGHNAISPGARVGVTYLPLRLPVAPALAIEAGRYLEGDAGPLARRMSGNPRLSSPTLERLGYDYATARAGLELAAGPSTVFLHAGLSYVRADLRGAQDALSGGDDDGPRLEIRDDPEVRALVPSARLGFLINF